MAAPIAAQVCAEQTPAYVPPQLSAEVEDAPKPPERAPEKQKRPGSAAPKPRAKRAAQGGGRFSEWDAEDVRASKFGYVVRKVATRLPRDCGLTWSQLQLKSLREQLEEHEGTSKQNDEREKEIAPWLRGDKDNESAPSALVRTMRDYWAWRYHRRHLISIVQEYEDAAERQRGTRALAEAPELGGPDLLLPDRLLSFLIDEANAPSDETSRNLQMARCYVSYLPFSKKANQCLVCRWALLDKDWKVRERVGHIITEFKGSFPAPRDQPYGAPAEQTILDKFDWFRNHLRTYTPGDNKKCPVSDAFDMVEHKDQPVTAYLADKNSS